MKEEKNHNAYTYISIVAIVAIVAVFVMFAGSGSKETQTPQTIVLDGGDVVGDARHFVDKPMPNQNIYRSDIKIDEIKKLFSESEKNEMLKNSKINQMYYDFESKEIGYGDLFLNLYYIAESCPSLESVKDDTTYREVFDLIGRCNNENVRVFLTDLTNEEMRLTRAEITDNIGEGRFLNFLSGLLQIINTGFKCYQCINGWFWQCWNCVTGVINIAESIYYGFW